MYETRADEGEEEGRALKIQKTEQTILTSWICLNFPMLSDNATLFHLGLEHSKSSRLCVALVDKLVYSHHQAWKCHLLVGGVSWSPSCVTMKFPLWGARVISKERELKYEKKKKKFAPVSSKCLGKEDATWFQRRLCRTVPSGEHRSKKHTWMASRSPTVCVTSPTTLLSLYLGVYTMVWTTISILCHLLKNLILAFTWPEKQTQFS